MGVLDHSGKFVNYFPYKSIEHHIHHVFPLKNFGSGLPLFDMIHGTYKASMNSPKEE